MDKKRDLSGIILASVTGAAVFAAMLVRAFLPMVVLPELNSVAITVLSVIALVLDAYFVKEKSRSYLITPIYAALIFGLFPWVACFVPYLEAIKAGLLGAVIFTVITFVFDSLMNRISSGRATKAAPVICGLGIYLAVQALAGII